ncbi:MAG: hypothetical protein ACFFBE_08810 [Promethearchaeota archaeon]
MEVKEVMYCSHCKTNVETKKMEFNIALAIFLAIFTGGIGLLIYVAIYLDREKRPRCVHCDAVCYIQNQNSTSSSPNYQLVSTSSQNQNQKTVLLTRIPNEKPKFCYNCGVELNQNEAAKYCPLCGTNTE